jgi:beta-galactosidase
LLQGSTLAALAAPHVEAKPLATTPAEITSESGVRERLLFDFGWRFHLGHACDEVKDFGFGKDQRTFAKAGKDVAAPCALDFDDGSWSPINLPHDWAVELPFVPSVNPPDGDDPRAAHGFKPLGREFPQTSIGWYRRVFDLPASDVGKRLTLEFDGVFRNCIVMLNGYAVGRNASGYASFQIDITDFANTGGKNTLVVRADASLGEGWFYEGAGIYRHVWLVKTDPQPVAQWGVVVRSIVQGNAATVTVLTEVENDGTRECRVVSTVFDPQGHVVGRAEAVGQAVEQRFKLTAPALWSVDAPNLYRVKTQIVSGGRMVDDMVTPFGIRTIRFDAEKGFFLNGQPLKLKGTCNHQDHAGVGSALPDAVHTARIAALKAMGSNAYRCAHNPPAPELLDACDRLGMLVIDETRRMSSDAEGLDELSRMIRRDRNHPSIILWSIGNEEPQQGTPRGARVAGTMKRLARRLDPTRPITAAVDDPDAWGLGITPVLDVLGCNYRTDRIAAFHARMPGKPVIGTETGSTVSTRGIYTRDPDYEVAYDTEFPWWASTAEAWWNIVARAPYIAGGFVWTGFDYRGEPTPQNRWPNVSSQFGILDLCGFPKDNYFYYRAWWQDTPVLHLLPHWNWANGQAVKIWCHSNLDQVELFLNGRSQGARTIERYNHAEWDVMFVPGVLEARGYKDGRLVLTAIRETADAPAAIRLTANRSELNADGEDVAVVTAEIVDVKGRAVPTAANLVTFVTTGPGAVLGVGNGDPRSHEPDKASQRSAFNGLCMALVQSGKAAGDIRIIATSPGLASGTLTMMAQTAIPRPFVP